MYVKHEILFALTKSNFKSPELKDVGCFDFCFSIHISNSEFEELVFLPFEFII